MQTREYTMLAKTQKKHKKSRTKLHMMHVEHKKRR